MSEKLITEDFIEASDKKIYVTDNHPSIYIVSGDTLEDVLLSLPSVSLTPEQVNSLKLLNTLPSSSNPFVLKDDLPTYYPISDSGSFKDSVEDLSDLPLSGNQVGDLRAVLNNSIVYIWNGSSWTQFITTGTIDHVQLINKNDDTSFLHVSSAEKAVLLASSHVHSNKHLLDQITDAGSGRILTNNERLRIPSTLEKSALAGSVGLPSLGNRYVTTVDPRLNTTKNPYITFGLPGSGTTYTGSYLQDLQFAIDAIKETGTSKEVNTIQVLPGLFLINDIDVSGITWGEDRGFTLEAVPVNSVTFRLASIVPTFSLLGGNKSPVFFKGINFEVTTSQPAILVERDFSLIEDCYFKNIFYSSTEHVLHINSNDVVIRNCHFSGDIQGINISGDNVLIENCTFDVLTTALTISGKNTSIRNCHFIRGELLISAFAENTIITHSEFTDDAPISDLGIATLWRTNYPGEYQYPYIGNRRTLGPDYSYADFASSDESGFLKAVLDYHTKELVILPGSYNLNSSITLPSGFSLIASCPDSVIINSSASPAFYVNNNSTIEGIYFNTENALEILGPNNTIKNCEFNSSGPGTLIKNDGYRNIIKNCKFYGGTGISSSGLILSVLNSLFSNIVAITSNSEVIFEGNLVLSGTVNFQGSNYQVLKNNFNQAPSKLATVNSFWRDNLPLEANNPEGIDNVELPLGRSLNPLIGTGAEKSQGGISFVETSSGKAVTLPIKFGFPVNKLNAYSLLLKWTSTQLTGNVRFRATITFKDSQLADIGTPVVLLGTSFRTKTSVFYEETLTLTSYDYNLTGDPTHVSILIERLGLDPLDTLAGNIRLTEATFSIPRE